MKRSLSLIVFMTILVFSFQNCSSNNFATSTLAENGATSSNKSGTMVPTTDFNKFVIWDNEHQQILDVDLQNGEMIAFEDYGSVRGEKYCLTPSELSEVRTIIASSSVCVPDIEEKAEQEQQMCAMLYQYPYASLANKQDEYRLGEKTSGCDVPSDLCGDQGPMLKNFTTFVIRNLEQKKCN
jgi:hypothetical protein